MALPGISYIKRTWYYLRRNGLRRTWYAVRERLGKKGRRPYEYVPVEAGELRRQRDMAQKKWDSGEYDTKFSIVVPAHCTAPKYLRAMIESVEKQSYPYWELIIADATEDDSVWDVVSKLGGVRWEGQAQEQAGQVQERQAQAGQTQREWQSRKILYLKLPGNKGISANTNEALPLVAGNYVGLLDHDDVLTKDALFEMAEQISRAKRDGIDAALIYSDEDKCDEDERRYYELHRKEEFNLDLILSNNYICHFMSMKSQIIKELGFRSDYDGAQDYDLVLRAVDNLGVLQEPVEERRIIHIPKVLYHWRCHSSSTAENPQSKQYAYDAGLRALQDFADRNGMQSKAEHLSHLGFYKLEYGENLFSDRRDIGVVGGRILEHGRIAGGRMDEEGYVFYEGTPENYSSYLHRAVLTQDALAVDLRCMVVREELRELFKETVGVPYQCRAGEPYFDVSILQEGADIRQLSLKFCKAVREKGYRILWLPELEVRL